MIATFYRAVLLRDLRKLFRQRDRLASAMVRPLLWLWVIGGGMQALAGGDYSTRLLPGILAMTILFGAMVGGLSIALDKDAGTMRLLVTAPVHAFHVLLSKTLAATIAGMVHAGLLGVVLLGLEGLNLALQPLGLPLDVWLAWVGHLSIPDAATLLSAAVLCAFSCASLGVLCGVFTRSLDGFAVMMNFVIFPVFFFSGALYPTQSMPGLARVMAQANPFTYGVDLMRHAFNSHGEYGVAWSMGILLASGPLLLALAYWRYRQGGAAVPLQHG